MPRSEKIYLEEQRSRHGRTTYYFRRHRDSPRIRLPDEYGTPDFWAAYRLARDGGEAANVPRYEREFVQARSLAVSRTVRSALKGAKARAALRGRAFDLDEDWVLAQIERQEGRCALSGVPFFAAHDADSRVHPFTPSLDRIDPKSGYTRDNVRVVVFAINMMLADWGEDVFSRVADGYRHVKRTSIPAPKNTVPAPKK